MLAAPGQAWPEISAGIRAQGYPRILVARRLPEIVAQKVVSRRRPTDSRSILTVR